MEIVCVDLHQNPFVSAFVIMPIYFECIKFSNTGTLFSFFYDSSKSQYEILQKQNGSLIGKNLHGNYDLVKVVDVIMLKINLECFYRSTKEMDNSHEDDHFLESILLFIPRSLEQSKRHRSPINQRVFSVSSYRYKTPDNEANMENYVSTGHSKPIKRFSQSHFFN